MREMLQPMKSFVTTEGLPKVVALENCRLSGRSYYRLSTGSLRMLKLVSSDQHERKQKYKHLIQDGVFQVF